MSDYTDNLVKAWDKKWAELIKSDRAAKKAGVLVGRFYSEPVADGKAIYLITKENKTRCKLELVTGLGDDWSIRRFGDKAWAGRNEVVDNIRWRDGMNAIFGKKKEER